MNEKNDVNADMVINSRQCNLNYSYKSKRQARIYVIREPICFEVAQLLKNIILEYD